MSFKSVDWSYSTDTLQVSEGGLQIGATNDEDSDSDAETMTITDVQMPSVSASGSGSSGRPILSNRVAPPSGFGRSNNNLGAGLGTFVGPTMADRTNPNLFILTFERDDLLNNTLCSSDGKTVYTITTKATAQSRKSPVTALITDFVKEGLSEPVATFSRLKTGSETIAFGPGKPMKRSDWLKASRPFQTGISSFTHNNINYRWIKQKEEYKNTTLELHSDSSSNTLGGSSLIATYKDSRRDWSVPPPALVIHQARIETHSAGWSMLDEIVLSLVLTEAILRATAKLQFDPNYLAATPFTSL